MCGIVGAVAQRNVVPILLEGLQRLEYRGYDSAGLVVVRDGELERVRSTGRVAELTERSVNTTGTLGIAHTRWATHGIPSERNAHPHVSKSLIGVVHNGIIENYESLRTRLTAAGYDFTSDTDTEVIAHLVHSHYVTGLSLLEAVRVSLTELVGAYAIGVVAADNPDQLICSRRGSPLLMGIGIGENFIASDVSALLPVTSKVIYLEEGDVVEIERMSYRIYNAAGMPIERPVQISEISNESVSLGNYRHYMQKEIHEQPQAIADTLESVCNSQSIVPGIFGAEAAASFAQIDSILILACGTSYHAGLVARYWLEEIAGIQCTVEIASEYRYRTSVPNPKTLVVVLSQSGETADTQAALNHAIVLGHHHTLAICNVPESALVRLAKLRFLTRAGPEIGVASTKAFITQLVALFLLTLVLAKQRKRLTAEQERFHLDALRHLPAATQKVLNLEPKIAKLAEQFANKHHALFLGRGLHYPIALEGALKLKEISYIHAEAYPAGELKHGPLALVDKDMPVISVAPNDVLLEKLKSNLHEVRARGGELYVFADAETHIREEEGVHIMHMPEHAGYLSPILHTIPLQLLAYYVALQKGTDVDKPRNLAKSVTVE
ncbi:MAG TPA: glutamine--fructose-6-phosphate transaminase (isomerizing) [Gallionella sp.]|jgi:glucosamine--fructose-6-phosphate aminotransferase (isomerizing)|nr:glutamine--fructose-6-phosphate transaminase (isomerizing) [Gallionella sp.]OGS68344.1 MAG: glutamine--fructose-6-phosphate aminotransferase [Gallionellales bacterium GWA2_54_124]OGT18576.1 MAG: glutamine--fructose-6-phosphate aminotransferase [Gallionellales bacterium RIFOXYD12_FULL_53_10]HCI54053.1 glutamine--fructose-6-phosphate transaminase (isomerizing) [Gallionella sp.]